MPVNPAERAKAWSLALQRKFGMAGVALVGFVTLVTLGFGIFLGQTESLAEAGVQQKLDAEERLSIGERLLYGHRIAATGMIVLGGLLLMTCPLWARRRDSPAASFSFTPVERLTWSLLILAMLLAGLSRAPRLDHSLWNDEEVAVRKFIVGSHSADPRTGDLEFQSVRWKRTLFYSLSGNNHITQSATSRIGHEIWSRATGSGLGEFSETALRLGSFLASLATIGLFGLWLARLGHPVAGITAAFVLALHPWHTRYAVEARGYSQLLLFLTALFYCLGPALRLGRWRDWIGFGLSQTLAILSFAASAFFLLPLNLIVMTLLIRKKDGISLGRWCFVCATGAATAAYFLLPTIVGSMGWLASLEEQAQPNDWVHLREFMSHLAFGISWNAGVPELDHGIGVQDLIESHSLTRFLVVIALPLAFLAGTILAWKRCRDSRLLILTTLGSLLLIVLFKAISTTPFHLWYAIYTIFWFALAIGFLAEISLRDSQDTTSGETDRIRWQGLKTWGPALVIIALYAGLCHLPNQRLRETPRHPMREAVEIVHSSAPALDASDTWTTLAIGAGSGQFHSYDPRVRTPETLEEFQGLVAEAARQDRRVAVYVTGPPEARRTFPGIFQQLDDPTRFREKALVKGIESFWSIEIFEQVIDAPPSASTGPAKLPVALAIDPGSDRSDGAL